MSETKKRAREEFYITKKGFHEFLLCPEKKKKFVCMLNDIEASDQKYIEENTEELFAEHGFPVSAELFHAFCAGEVEKIEEEAVEFMKRWENLLVERYGRTEEDQPLKDIEDAGISGKYANRYLNRFEAEIESLGEETGATTLPRALREWMALLVTPQEHVKVQLNPDVNEGLNTVVTNIAETIGTLKDTMDELKEHVEAFWEEALGREVSFGGKEEEDGDYTGNSGSQEEDEDEVSDESEAEEEEEEGADADMESESDGEKEWENSDEEE